LKVRGEWHLSVLPVKIWREKQIDRLILDGLDFGVDDPKAYLKQQLEEERYIFAFVRRKKAIAIYIFEAKILNMTGTHFKEDIVEEQLRFKASRKKYAELDLYKKFESEKMLKTFSEDGKYWLIFRWYAMNDFTFMGIRTDKAFYGCYQILRGAASWFLVLLGVFLIVLSEFLSEKYDIPVADDFLTNLIAIPIAVGILWLYKTLLERKLYKSE
jgi:hypothetical protein